MTKVLEIAKAEVGYLEKRSNSKLYSKTDNAGSANYNKYARDMDNTPNFFNGPKNGYDWCAIFVCWCFVQAFGAERAMKLLFLPERSAGASCTYLASRFKAQGRLFAADPKPGDLILYTRDGGSKFYHVGIVTKVTDTKIYTIEGNTSGGSAVIANGGGVFEKEYNKKSVSAWYARPNYDAETVPVEQKPETKTTGIKTDMFLNKNVKGQIIDIGLKVDHGEIWYQVHELGGRWLPQVSGFDPNDFANGYAGNHTPIDAIRVYYNTPKGEPYKQARYAVKTEKSGNRWLPEQVDDYTNKGMDGYAGNLGEAITDFKWRVDDK
jgi:hypothetical protein